jgi:hypothetical protein
MPYKALKVPCVLTKVIGGLNQCYLLDGTKFSLTFKIIYAENMTWFFTVTFKVELGVKLSEIFDHNYF